MNLAKVVTAPSLSPPTTADIERLTKISRTITGIELGREKSEFIRSRLDQHLKNLGFQSYFEYCSRLEATDAHHERVAFAEALTTNTTHFFREDAHYKWLREEGLEELLKQGAGQARDLILWSAACSTGQELYSALMTVGAYAKANPVRFRGIGTDISAQVLKDAERAVYGRSEILKIPNEYRPDFLLSSKSSNDLFRIAPVIREKAEWKKANLVDRSTMDTFQADIVFLRNVLIYFSSQTQDIVLDNVLSKLRRGGFLMTGHTETSSLRLKQLRAIQPTIYQKVA